MDDRFRIDIGFGWGFLRIRCHGFDVYENNQLVIRLALFPRPVNVRISRPGSLRRSWCEIA